MSITPRQRALDCIAGKATDKVPVHLTGLSGYAGSLILGREAYIGGGIQQWREACAMWEGGEAAHKECVERSLEDAWQITLKTEQDIHRFGYWRCFHTPIDRRDEHTFVFGDRDDAWWVMQHDPATEMFQEIERGGPPPPRTVPELAKVWETQRAEFEADPDRFESEARALARERGDAFVRHGRDHVVRLDAGGIYVSFREPLWMEAVAERPDIVEQDLDRQLQWALWQMEEYATLGARLVFGGGDTASNIGPFFAPQAYRELLLPRWKAFADACHDRGLLYMFASDGNLWPITDMMFNEAGIDGYLEIDRLVGMDLARLRETYPDVTLMGNISSITLARGTKQQVIDETRDCLEQAKALGRIIVGNSNYIVPGTPPENLFAMLETLEAER